MSARLRALAYCGSMHGPYVPVDPAKLVDVERDGLWYPGFLEGWRRYDDGWMAYVRYTVDVGR